VVVTMIMDELSRDVTNLLSTPLKKSFHLLHSRWKNTEDLEIFKTILLFCGL